MPRYIQIHFQFLKKETSELRGKKEIQTSVQVNLLIQNTRNFIGQNIVWDNEASMIKSSVRVNACPVSTFVFLQGTQINISINGVFQLQTVYLFGRDLNIYSRVADQQVTMLWPIKEIN